MKECKQFKDIYNFVAKHSKDIRRVGNNPFATGYIYGYKFRMFQEKESDSYIAYLLIKDETAKGTMWSAFYTINEIERWIDSKCGGKGKV